jgi:hypothetical protein
MRARAASRSFARNALRRSRASDSRSSSMLWKNQSRSTMTATLITLSAIIR